MKKYKKNVKQISNKFKLFIKTMTFSLKEYIKNS